MIGIGVRKMRVLYKNVVTGIASYVTYNLLVLNSQKSSVCLFNVPACWPNINWLMVVLTNRSQAQDSLYHYLLHMNSCWVNLIPLYNKVIFWAFIGKIIPRPYKLYGFGLSEGYVRSCVTDLYVFNCYVT